MGNFPEVEDAFRRHRHDVMNDLQLVKAYLQLSKPVEATAALDRLSDWLRSLSLIQSQQAEPLFLWTAAQCPHVLVDDIHISHWTQAVLHELSGCLLWLNERANEQGFRTVRVHIHQATSEIHSDSPAPVTVDLEATEEMSAWWNNMRTVQSDLHSWSHVQVRCGS